MAHSNYRIEIVANLNGYLRDEGVYDRLTVTSEYIRAHAVPRGYDVPLDGLRDQARRVELGESPGFPSANAGPVSVNSILEDRSTEEEALEEIKPLAAEEEAEGGDPSAILAYGESVEMSRRARETSAEPSTGVPELDVTDEET